MKNVIFSVCKAHIVVVNDNIIVVARGVNG